MSDVVFRLRISFRKCDRLRFLSHLELVRAMERVIRRAQLPYLVSQGFSAHMRHAPGPALPVGTSGQNELFDVWLSEYLPPAEALVRLKSATIVGLPILGVSYVSPGLKGLQATHNHEEYQVLAVCPGQSAEQIAARLQDFIQKGELVVRRQKKTKVYNLESAVGRMPIVEAMGSVGAADGGSADGAGVSGGMRTGGADFTIELFLRSGEQGAIKPELLLREAFADGPELHIRSITRTGLYPDEA